MHWDCSGSAEACALSSFRVNLKICPIIMMKSLRQLLRFFFFPSLSPRYNMIHSLKQVQQIKMRQDQIRWEWSFDLDLFELYYITINPNTVLQSFTANMTTFSVCGENTETTGILSIIRWNEVQKNIWTVLHLFWGDTVF